MSPLEPERIQKESKFTRGEKCIFAHLVTTFMLIIILVLIYFVHLCLIEHKGNDIFKMTRRRGTVMNESTLMDYKGLGLVYLKGKSMRALCNAVLIQHRWSFAPGHCVAARSEPHLSDLLPSWTIKYRADSYLYTESRIKRSIAHPHFNNDDLDNNIGLFEHDEILSVPLFKCKFPVCMCENHITTSDLIVFAGSGISLEEFNVESMGFISWDLISNPGVMHNDVIVRTMIEGPMNYSECKLYVTPITNLRGHEFCVVVGKENNAVLIHGALLYANSNIVGFFSWGQNQPREFPIVILNITSFKDWLDYITL